MESVEKSLDIAAWYVQFLKKEKEKKNDFVPRASADEIEEPKKHESVFWLPFLLLTFEVKVDGKCREKFVRCSLIRAVSQEGVSLLALHF